MDSSDPQKNEYASPLMLSARSKLMIVGIGLVAAVYFGFIEPAKQHMAALEKQCGQLTQIVKQMQGHETAAAKGLQLIEVLDRQGNKLAEAEISLNKLIAMRERLVQESQEVVEAISTLERLHTVQHKVVGYNKTLVQLTDTFAEMDEVASALADSNDVALQAKRSLESLSDMQTEMVHGITAVSEQLTALENKIQSRVSKLPEA